MPTITSVLVANRGEIARRVFATCRRRGIATVAVFSDADAGAPHVREADVAVRLPGTAPADTYLRGDLIIDAARRAGADAIHPGYGFLSENAEFAAAVQEAGLVWIGPDRSAIEIMGSKVVSKSRMASAGVPVLDRLAPEDITQEHFPVLVKASAGGGGRGMRVVRSLTDLSEAMDSASREAGSAFGDSTVFCERYLEAGHHVEVQVLADAHGTVWALGERECSLQRRHQKVIEEAPSPLVDRVGGDLRERLLTAARDAAAAVDYRGAGTVEFLADDRGEFWFLEMNTRLQVEHPVTECVTGVDLVGLQLEVAEGRPLVGEEPTMTGHSIEARLYAEDPAAGWTPQSGAVHLLEFDAPTTQFAIPGSGAIWVDAGVESGSVVSTHYDSMLAKVISWAPERADAARALAAALRHARMHGVTTNRELLVASLLHPQFLAGEADTRFYEQHPPADLLGDRDEEMVIQAVVAALADIAADRATAPLAGLAPGFRNLPGGFHERSYQYRERRFDVRYRFGRNGLELAEPPAGVESLQVAQLSADRVVLDLDGVLRSFRVARYDTDTQRTVTVDGQRGSTAYEVIERFVEPGTQVAPGALVAAMPGTVTRVAVAVGDSVTAGSPLVWLEAMKMEHPVCATADGVVSEIGVGVGDQVQQGAVVAVVTAEETK